ncbi:hypothetical protein BIW11_03347 [Tropilaelaps mercedesae]|uniref:Uncharacterized protein n=1 Tax=Tropilaelaps mercedesae TaxID=418985 RepID=A0A1V9XMY6_9ACAR|nr:hypothetical protein BIW11_03347 [Tropilaelaps mercedesae]
MQEEGQQNMSSRSERETKKETRQKPKAGHLAMAIAGPCPFLYYTGRQIQAVPKSESRLPKKERGGLQLTQIASNERETSTVSSVARPATVGRRNSNTIGSFTLQPHTHTPTELKRRTPTRVNSRILTAGVATVSTVVSAPLNEKINGINGLGEKSWTPKKKTKEDAMSAEKWAMKVRKRTGANNHHYPLEIPG